MTSKKHIFADTLFTVITLMIVFLINLFLVWEFNTKTMTPMIFVLGVFLVSWKTQGYHWGIIASVISVLLVNWAFTYPYWAFDLMSPECISSAAVMMIVATMTGALTTRLKQQEKRKAELDNFMECVQEAIQENQEQGPRRKRWAAAEGEGRHRRTAPQGLRSQWLSLNKSACNPGDQSSITGSGRSP